MKGTPRSRHATNKGLSPLAILPLPPPILKSGLIFHVTIPRRINRCRQVNCFLPLFLMPCSDLVCAGTPSNNAPDGSLLHHAVSSSGDVAWRRSCRTRRNRQDRNGQGSREISGHLCGKGRRPGWIMVRTLSHPLMSFTQRPWKASKCS